MNGLRWAPHVTVAAIIEQDGRFLLVEEQVGGELRLNNPAGHLEPGESLEQAVVREVLEETARPFVPEALLGVYLLDRTDAGGTAVTYLRFAFTGRVGEPLPGRTLDCKLRDLTSLRKLGIVVVRAAPFLLLDGRRPASQLAMF